MEGIEERVKIEPIMNTLGVSMIEGVIYTGYNNLLVGTNTKTGRVESIRKIQYEIVRVFLVYDMVLISTVAGVVYLYSPKYDKIEVIIRDKIVKSVDTVRDRIVIGDSEGAVVTVEIEKEETGIIRTSELPQIIRVDSTISIVRAVEIKKNKRKYREENRILVVGDASGTVSMFNSDGNVIYRSNCHSGQVTLAVEIDGVIITGGVDGNLVEHRIGEEEVVREIGRVLTGGTVYNNNIVVISGSSILFISREMDSIIDRVLAVPEIVDIEIVNDRMILTTEENDIVIGVVEGTEVKIERIIIGNNDEITDIIKIEDSIIVGTNSRYLRRIKVEGISQEGGVDEFTSQSALSAPSVSSCSGDLFRGSNTECILCVCGLYGVFYSGSKDGYLAKYSTGLDLLSEVKIDEGISSMAAGKGILITGTENGILSGWKMEDLSLVFTVSVSTSEITGIVVKNKKIFCTSKDKEIKVVRMTGQIESMISGHKKGIWSISEDNETILTGSTDRTARIWKDSVNIQLSHNSSVVKVLLTDRAVTATSDGVIRIWNRSTYKELAALRLTEEKEERIWAINRFREHEYIVGVGPRILILRDRTEEIEKEKEEKKKENHILKEKALILMRNKEFVGASVEYYKLGLEKELKGALRKIGNEEISPLITEVLLDSERFSREVSKWAKSPLLFFVVERIVKEALKRRWKISKRYAEDLSATLFRTAERLNAAY